MAILIWKTDKRKIFWKVWWKASLKRDHRRKCTCTSLNKFSTLKYSHAFFFSTFWNITEELRSLLWKINYFGVGLYWEKGMFSFGHCSNRNRSRSMKLKRCDDKSENIMKYKNAKSRKILVRGILQSQLVPFNIAFGISFPNPPSKYFKDEWNRNGLE